jgi:SAM-dependent methyltransferase
MKANFLKSEGVCSTCNNSTEFISEYSWLRDHYVCQVCGSIPRERALMCVIEESFPSWRGAIIHESSPGQRGASIKLQKEASHYIPSQFFPGHKSGIPVNGIQCENLESLSFADQSIDLHITQDVLEHIFNPDITFKEIARTLKPGGMHIFSVPLVNKFNPSRRRARLHDGKIEHLEAEQYHGSPVGDGRSLVTIDWGFDICDYIFKASGLYTKIIYIDDISRGIRADFIEILVTFKPMSSEPACL